MTIKRVMRFDPTQKKLRLFRLIWNTGNVGDGIGYSAKLSVSLVPKLYGFKSAWDGWRLTVLGMSVHKRVSFGGRFV